MILHPFRFGQIIPAVLILVLGIGATAFASAPHDPAATAVEQAGAGGVTFHQRAPAPAAPEAAIQEREQAGAWASPAAAWHHLLLARAADCEGKRDLALTNYRIAVNLDPYLLSGWLGLAGLGFPSNPSLLGEGFAGAVGAVSGSWEARRRLLAALIPALWTSTTIVAVLLLGAVGLRHLSRPRHVVLEGVRPHLGGGRTGTIATLLCLVPLAVQWGLGAAAAAYAGIVRADWTRKEKAACLAALAWLVLTPAAWMIGSTWIAPVEADGPVWLLDRAQRETPSPALRQRILDLYKTPDTGGPAALSPDVSFAAGMIYRRTGDWTESKKAFTHAASTSGLLAPYAAVNLGNLQFWSGDAPGAARRYETVLDDPKVKIEARYNLALALSRLHRFEEADQQLEEVARLDFDRIRSTTRAGNRRTPIDAMDGMVGPNDLQRLVDGRKKPAVPAPPIVGWLFPGGRPTAAPVAILLATFIGIASGTILRHRLRVHACSRCGAPICRRCATRVAARAYCLTCAGSLAHLAPGDYTRLLLRRVLGKDKRYTDRLLEWGTCLLPGIGPILRGATVGGAISAWFFTLGMVLATRAAWAFPPTPSAYGLDGLLRILGLSVAALSFGGSSLLARRLIKRRSVRRFFEKDSYRMAA